MTIVDNIEATGKEAEVLLAENADLKEQLAAAPTPTPVPPPTPPPGEAPPPIGVWPPLAVPLFGAGPFIVGTTVTRIPGEYPNAKGIAGRRYRNGSLIPGATGAAYTLTAADAGQILEFEEQAESTDGVTEWFKSPAVVPVAGSISSVVSDRVEQAIKDMQGRNDFILRGYESFKNGWYMNAENTMGAHPKIDEVSIATWSNLYHVAPYWGQKCSAMLPWTVIFDGPNDQSQFTGVELVDIYGYVLSTATKRWSQVSYSPTASGTNYGKPNTGLPAQSQERENNNRVIVPPKDKKMFWHGWGSKVPINPDDVACTFVRCRARLVGARGGNDIDKAQLGIQVGNDYYLSMTQSFDAFGYAPSNFIARTRLITKDWQTFCGFNLNDASCSQNTGKTGLTLAEFRANPPPLG